MPAWESVNSLGLSLFHKGLWAEAETSFREALDLAPHRSVSPLGIAVLLGNLAQCSYMQGDIEGAIELGLKSLNVRFSACENADDAPVARARSDLAVYYSASGRHAEALHNIDSAIAAVKEILGSDSIVYSELEESRNRIVLAAQTGTLDSNLPQDIELDFDTLNESVFPQASDPEESDVLEISSYGGM